MPLRRLLLVFMGIFLLGQFACIFISTWFVIAQEHRRAKANALEELDRIHRYHHHELAGALMLGHDEIVEHQLRNIQERERIRAAIWTERRSFGDPGFATHAVQRAYPVAFADETYGQLYLAHTKTASHGITTTGAAIALAQLALGLFFAAVGFVWTRRAIVSPLTEIVKAATVGYESGARAQERYVLSELQRLSASVQQFWRERQERSKYETIGAMSRQVAHDIRSPLAALDVVATNCDAMPEDERHLLRIAVSRVRGIADQLLSTRDDGPLEDTSAVIDPTPICVSVLIDELVGEKKVEFSTRSNLTIESRHNNADSGVFVRADRLELTRILSNLVNNAIEVMPDGGEVGVGFCSEADDVEIYVEDNGPGMPEEVRRQIGAEPVSAGKRDGYGLGLSHAYRTAKKWGGDLQFATRCGGGTRVMITAKRVVQPSWFTSLLRFPTPCTLLVVDDDPSIHQIWDRRRQHEAWATQGVDVQHFTTLQSFIDAHRSLQGRPIQVLCDYEFKGDNRSGLDAIETMALSHVATLVTSHADAAEVQQQANRLGVKVLSKSRAGHIPVEIVKAEGCAYVFKLYTSAGLLCHETQRFLYLDEARRHAGMMLKRGENATCVKVSSENNLELGAVYASATETWVPSPNFPQHRCAWH